MKGDGTGVRRLTRRPGPDGGPFFSWDGKQVAFRGRPMPPGAEMDDYLALLKQALWRPTELELFVMDRDGAERAPRSPGSVGRISRRPGIPTAGG